MFFPRGNPFMPSTPFTDPLYFARPAMDAWTRAVEFSHAPSPDAGDPIDIKTNVSDPGLSVQTGPQSITISGTAQGGVEVGADTLTGVAFGTYHKSRGIRVGLDVDKAPTQDIFGNRNYREKNSRSFYVGAAKGQSAQKIAERLAREINGGDDFRAKVVPGDNGSATIQLSHR